MLALVGLMFFILFLIGYRACRSLLAPNVLNSGLWLLIIILYYVFPHNYYAIENRFPLSILIWVICFDISALVAMYVTSSNQILQKYNKKVYQIEVILAVAGTLVIAIGSIRLALTSDYFFLYLRSLSTGLDENIQADGNLLWGYFRSAMIIVYLAELVKGYNSSKTKIYLFLFLNILICFVTMAKSQLFIVLVSSIIVLKQKNIITNKQIGASLFVFSILSFLIQIARMGEGDDFSIGGFLSGYIISGSVAFDVFNPDEISQNGSNVFRFFEAILNRLGIIESSNETILSYTSIGRYAITNVYTILYPFYVDFGCAGVAIFGIIYGFLSGFLYKKSKYNDAALIMYALIASAIVFGFFGELLFTNLSTYIQYLLYVLMLYYLKVKVKIKNNI